MNLSEPILAEVYLSGWREIKFPKNFNNKEWKESSITVFNIWNYISYSRNHFKKKSGLFGETSVFKTVVWNAKHEQKPFVCVLEIKKIVKEWWKCAKKIQEPFWAKCLLTSGECGNQVGCVENTQLSQGKEYSRSRYMRQFSLKTLSNWCVQCCFCLKLTFHSWTRHFQVNSFISRWNC